MAQGIKLVGRNYKVLYAKRNEGKKGIVDSYFIQTSDKVKLDNGETKDFKYSFSAKKFVELDKNGKAKTRLMEKDSTYFIEGHMVVDSYKQGDDYIKSNVVVIDKIEKEKAVKKQSETHEALEEDLPF